MAPWSFPDGSIETGMGSVVVALFKQFPPTGQNSVSTVIRARPDPRARTSLPAHAATVGKRKIALVLSPDRAGFDGSHELTMVNLATPGHPRLEIDAMAILWSD